jgi:hypothetical protein
MPNQLRGASVSFFDDLGGFLDKTENEFRRDPGKFAELRDDDFSSHS